jgi:hypothetical protein
MDTKYKVAESFQIARMARKLFVRNDTQKKGVKNYNQLVSLRLGHMVQNEFLANSQNFSPKSPINSNA